ncbi:MAG TPA: PilZ domain-containing protein [Pirellulales bacterium]|nr:PilZ domain-containing protein [Pirellulales bacterium]
MVDFKTTHVPEVDGQSLHAALEKLQKWDDKNAGHQSEKRSGERFGYKNRPVVIVVPASESAARGRECGEASVSFPVYTRNLSRSGLSFLIPREVFPRVLTDAVLPVYVQDLLTVGREIQVGMPMNNGEVLWVVSKIIRTRLIHEGLSECGLQFVSKGPAEKVSEQT